MGIDVTISSAQCHPTVPESVSFYSAWKGKEFCYCLFMFSAPPNGELYACCCSMLEKKVKLLGSQQYNLISIINLIQMEFPSCIPYVGLNIVLNITGLQLRLCTFVTVT